MRDTNNRIAVRKKAEDLHGRLENPLFSLYLFFLQHILDILADINRQLQKPNQSLYVTCCKIKAFKTTLMEPLLVDPGKNTTEENLRPIDDVFEHLSGSEFQKHKSQCLEHSLLTERQMADAKKVMYSYLLVLGKTIEERFPELDFMTKQLCFTDPPQRKLHLCDTGLVVDKFSNDQSFCKTTVHKQYRTYCHDTTLDFLYEVTCNSNPVAFFVKLYNEEEYNELARLALLVLVISPDSVACERGFSTMNFIKNQYRTRLTQDKLNVCMALAMDTRDVVNFPYHKLL